MKKNIYLVTIAALLALAVLALSMLSGCTQASRASYNISKEANNFNVTRRLAVINARTDKPVFELIGNFSLSNNTDNELEITVETEQGVYKKHFVYLNEWTIYVVEDVSGATVDPYHYEVNFLPEMIMPFTVTMSD
jgi:outer membrane lipoprotein-sorting protein